MHVSDVERIDHKKAPALEWSSAHRPTSTVSLDQKLLATLIDDRTASSFSFYILHSRVGDIEIKSSLNFNESPTFSFPPQKKGDFPLAMAHRYVFHKSLLKILIDFTVMGGGGGKRGRRMIPRTLYFFCSRRRWQNRTSCTWNNFQEKTSILKPTRETLTE